MFTKKQATNNRDSLEEGVIKNSLTFLVEIFKGNYYKPNVTYSKTKTNKQFNQSLKTF